MGKKSNERHFNTSTRILFERDLFHNICFQTIIAIVCQCQNICLSNFKYLRLQGKVNGYDTVSIKHENETFLYFTVSMVTEENKRDRKKDFIHTFEMLKTFQQHGSLSLIITFLPFIEV